MAFITLDRKFLDWQWYGDINTKTVFIHLLLLANWEDTKYKGIILHRGEAAVTYDEIAKQLGISYQQVRTAFQHLENAETLTIKRSSKFLIVTLKKYDEYQSKKQSNNNQITIKQQSDNNQNEERERSKEKEEKIYDINKHENHLTNKPYPPYIPPRGTRGKKKMDLSFDPDAIERRAQMENPTL